jgi:hypothetical protein
MKNNESNDGVHINGMMMLCGDMSVTKKEPLVCQKIMARGISYQKKRMKVPRSSGTLFLVGLLRGTMESQPSFFFVVAQIGA